MRLDETGNEVSVVRWIQVLIEQLLIGASLKVSCLRFVYPSHLFKHVH